VSRIAHFTANARDCFFHSFTFDTISIQQPIIRIIPDTSVPARRVRPVCPHLRLRPSACNPPPFSPVRLAALGGFHPAFDKIMAIFTQVEFGCATFAFRRTVFPARRRFWLSPSASAVSARRTEAG
jgi:hypothetical protein